MGVPAGVQRKAEVRPCALPRAKAYMVRPPMPPSYLFLIDVSAAACASGAAAAACQAVKRTLADVPGPERALVGVATFDSAVQFFRMRPGGLQPQMLVMPDVAEPYAPLPAGLVARAAPSLAASHSSTRSRLPAPLACALKPWRCRPESLQPHALQVPLAEYREALEELLEALPSMSTGGRLGENASAAAVSAAVDALKGTGALREQRLTGLCAAAHMEDGARRGVAQGGAFRYLRRAYLPWASACCAVATDEARAKRSRCVPALRLTRRALAPALNV